MYLNNKSDNMINHASYLNAERKLRLVGLLLKGADRYGVPRAAQRYIYRNTDTTLLRAADVAGYAKRIDAGVLAILWMAISAKMNLLVVSPDDAARAMLLSIAITFAHRIEQLHIIASSPESLWFSDMSRNTISIYGKWHSQGRVVRLVDRSMELHSDRIVLEKVSGGEAKMLFAAASSGVPFMSSIRAVESGKALIEKLTSRQFKVADDSINELDMAISIDGSGIMEMTEFGWLSRAEVVAGEVMRNGDSLRTCKIVEGGKPVAHAIPESKTIRAFGLLNGLSVRYSMIELSARRDVIAGTLDADPRKWRDAFSSRGSGP